jgi:hypothetical protein
MISTQVLQHCNTNVTYIEHPSDLDLTPPQLSFEGERRLDRAKWDDF